MKPLKERNQAAVGAVSLIVLVLSVIAAFNAPNLPIIGGGTTYSAYFAESAGLQPDNEVQVAGIRVGAVSDVELEGSKVRVSFRIDRQGADAASRMGDETTASIEIKTLLGEKSLSLTPAGSGHLDPNRPIPLSRTTTPFQLQDAFDELNQTVSDVDTKQLARSFDVLSETFGETPKHLTKAMDGLAGLSKTIASRDEELNKLLGNTHQASKLLSGRNDQLKKMLSDGNRLLAELQGRKKAIRALLSGTKNVSEQLSGLVADNKDHLRPTLTTLKKVTGVLRRNADNIDRSLELLAPFSRIGANATGNGRWFEGYLCGFMPPTIEKDAMHINSQGCESPVAAPNQGVGGN